MFVSVFQILHNITGQNLLIQAQGNKHRQAKQINEISQVLLCAEQEALSVVSEEQPLYEASYAATAPAMHMKTEMTSPPIAFAQADKASPEPGEQEWAGPVAQNPGKRVEHVNGTG